MTALEKALYNLHSYLRPSHTVAPTPQSCDLNSGTWQPARIYSQLQPPVARDRDLRPFLPVSGKKHPLGKLDSVNDCRDLLNDCHKNNHKTGSSRVVTHLTTAPLKPIFRSLLSLSEDYL